MNPAGLYRRDVYVMETAASRGVPVAAVIGGGYSRDIDKLALRHSIVHRAATQVEDPERSDRHHPKEIFNDDIHLFQVWKERGM